MKREPQMIAYRTALPVDPPWCTAYTHGAFGTEWHRLGLVTERASARKRSSRPVSEPLAMLERDGWCSFPGRYIKPLPKHVLGAELLGVVDLLGERHSQKYRDPYALIKCACGASTRVQVAEWRAARRTRCPECSRVGSKKYNPVPNTGVRARIAADVAQLRKNPMGARTVREILPFHVARRR